MEGKKKNISYDDKHGLYILCFALWIISINKITYTYIRCIYTYNIYM